MGISQELQELREILAALDRLNPEWKVHHLGYTPKIMFSKNTEDGTYEGIIDITSYKSHEGGADTAMIEVTLLNGTKITKVFSKNYSWDAEVVTWVLRDFIENTQAYREEVSRQELKRTKAREAEQAREEAEQEARDRFLGRKTRRR